MAPLGPGAPEGAHAHEPGDSRPRLNENDAAGGLPAASSAAGHRHPTQGPSSSLPSGAPESSTAPSHPSFFQTIGEDYQAQQIKDGITRFFYPARNSTPDRRSRIVNRAVKPDGDRDEALGSAPSPPTKRRSRPEAHRSGLERVAESTGLTPTSAGAAAGVFRDGPEEAAGPPDEAERDADFVTHFWRTYDDIIILSIFTQIGILFRLAASTWFTYFDGVFAEGSALFVVLPMNCLSCFIMGLLCSGERLMEIVATRFTPPRLQQDVFHEAEDRAEQDELERQRDEAMVVAHDFEHGSRAAGLLRRLRRRRRRRQRHRQVDRYFHSWEPPVHLNQDLRDVQLLALERRMRASKCLVLFPVRKQDVDVMEHYFRQGYKKDDRDHDYDPELNRLGDAQDLGFDLQLAENDDSDTGSDSSPSPPVTPDQTIKKHIDESTAASRHIVKEEHGNEKKRDWNRRVNSQSHPVEAATSSANQEIPSESDGDETPAEQRLDFDLMIQEVHANITDNVNRLSRVDLAAGWDKGTTPDEMSDDLMLGLRDGFCGALSSFSSWQASMVNLMRNGQFGEAFTGYMLGIQLPIIAYRFGQHVAVYIFIWRCRWETRIDRRRGYGIRLNQDGSDSDASDHEDDKDDSDEDENAHLLVSVRAVATAIFVIALITQVTSLFFYGTPENQLLALSLLFSPLGVLSRWRLSRLNDWRPTFPLGTFSCNILACALSGSLGHLLAGNPHPRQRIVLQSLVAGFGATLSSVAAFIAEILAGVDPILFRFDGFFYALVSVAGGLCASFIFGSTEEWADQTETKTDLYSNFTGGDVVNATGDAAT